jgi:small subunit ribosomal protein S16
MPALCGEESSMVRIRLFRTGTNKRPLYRIVAVDRRRRRESRVLEQLGTYDPRGGGGVKINEPAFEGWVSRGAELSDTVGSLMRRYRREQASAPRADA